MRLLHVHDQAFFQGGVEQILFDTAVGLSERGYPQALLFNGESTDAKFIRPFEYSGNDLSIVKSFRPDVVLLHKVSDSGRIVELTTAIPTAHMVHDHDMVCPRKHKYFPLSLSVCNKPAGISCYLNLCCIQKAASDSLLPITLKGTANVKRQLQAAQKVKRFIVGSRYMKSELETNGIAGDKIEIIHPVPAALRAPVALPQGESANVLFVGQIIRGKGVDLLLKALACLKGDWQATIVGEGNHLDTCKQLAEQLGMKNRVRFPGWVPHAELDSYYRSARLLAVPSRWPEPFGMVGIEAMARGRPVVAFANGGIPDWLDHGTTGFLIPAGDTSAMAAAIQGLLDDKSLAAQMGQAGANHVQNSFSHQVFLDQIKQQMDQIK
ncbi:MAG: glycosyltransferase family 4 protein [Xanthomonadales bacterium]|nr:glycosyltransferase family 4 protein [Xanthomonadales bacterium]